MNEFTYCTKNRTYFFVDPVNFFIHTQGVESLYSHAKRDLRMKNGNSKTKEFEYLIFFIKKIVCRNFNNVYIV
jgi:hypothetical protein